MATHLVGVLERALVVAIASLCGRAVREENVVGGVECDRIAVELGRSGVVLGGEGLVGLCLELVGLGSVWVRERQQVETPTVDIMLAVDYWWYS